MASLIESGAPPAYPAPQSRCEAAPSSNPGGAPRWTRGQWLLAGVGVLLLHVSHLLACRPDAPLLWFPPAGLALALVAWLGRRGALLAALDALAAALQFYLIGEPLFGAVGWPTLVGAFWFAGLEALEALAGWWLYHELARGARRLDDPRSATLFLFLVPGLCAGLFAAARTIPIWFLGVSDIPAWRWLVVLWISHALGLLALAPLLLAVITPWLVRHGLVPGEPSRDPQRRTDIATGRLLRGDWIELAGLALGTSILGLLLVRPSGFQGDYWQLWGASLLLIVWASIRQGMRGGVVVSATAAVVPLSLIALLRPTERLEMLLQGNLLAQCSAALLVTASANWVRGSEARYRRVVGHIPVVLYSAQVVRPGTGGRAPQANITFISPASRDILGAAPEQLLGSYDLWLQRVHPSDREIVLAALSQLARQRAPVTCEYRLSGNHGRNKDRGSGSALAALNGHIIAVPNERARECWLRDTLAPVFGADGVLEGWDGVVTDITEQRTLADDLRHTTSMFYTLVANLPAGVFFVQAPSGRPILVNTRARQLLGQREDPTAGIDHLPQIYHLHRPDGSPYPVDELPVTHAIRHGLTTMRDDIVVHRPDGCRIPLVTWAAPIELRGQNQPHAAVWVFEDLTLLRQAEAARRDTEARLRAVVETMVEGLVVQQGETIVECNPAACVILGLSAERLRGRSLWDPGWHYLREDGTLLPLNEHPARVSLETGRAVRDVILGVRPGSRGGVESNGSDIRWVLVNAMPLRRETGQSTRSVFITLADVTAHRQAQEVLRLSEEKYRELVETLPLMVLQFDREGQITYINPATQSITGYDLGDLCGTNWQSAIHPEDLPGALAMLTEVQADRTMRAELRYRAKDGREQVGYLIAQPRCHSGQVIGVTVLVVDMTRERRLEQELQRAQRLELIGRLSSGIAHDFNNLLNVILTLADLAQVNLANDHPVRADLQRIVEAGQQAAGLAGQLLAFSKQRRTVARTVDVNRVASRTAEMVRATLPSPIDLDQLLTEQKLCVQADEMQLHQVLMNLCLNARDAMPAGGRLVIRTEAVKEANGDGEGPSSWARICVQDNGQGMSDDVQARIFDPFFSTKEHGTGLGLAVVQQIVRAHGGEVKVWSKPGEGSRFEIWLPSDPSEPATAGTPG